MNKLISPTLRKQLEKELIAKKDELVKVEGELVNDNLPVIQTKKYMDLATSQHYIDNFINMTPLQINEFIDKQSDLLIMHSKNAALEFLAKALETGDSDDLEMYLKLVQASAVVSQEKQNTKKALGLAEGEVVKPKQYVAERVTQDEWEQKYKPGTPVINPPEENKEPLYYGPTDKSIN